MSMRYNPFAYLRSEKDILKLVNTLIANTKGDGEKAGEDFWVKSERLFYCALIGYIWYEAPEEEKNFTTLLEMINASEAREDDPEFQSPVDLMFERLEEKDPEHFAVRQYKKFLLSAGKTRSSILISCGARLAPFDIKELRDLIQQKVLGLLSVSGNTEYMHSIANLALLNTADNAALNNSTFDVKRNDIIQMDKKGQYIPFCTKMVFLKYYTPSAENQLHFWGQADRIAYIKAINDVLSDYIEPIVLEKEETK